MISARIWRQTLGILRKNPVTLLPFFIIGLFDTISLVFIYLAPRPPLSIVLAPPIRTFFGERYLHYPFNLLLIPQLFRYTHIMVTATIGVLMTGLAIGLINQAKETDKPGILSNLICALKRYLTLLLIWLIIFVLAFLVYKIPSIFLSIKNTTIAYTIFYLSFLVTIIIQAIFVYVFPAVLIEQRGLISAIKRGLSFSRKHFLTTLMLVVIPALFYLPIIILRAKTTVLMSRFFPEIVLVILGAGIIITLLIDCLVTYSTTILFLNQRRA